MIKKNNRIENFFIRAAALLTTGLLAGSSLHVQAMETGNGETKEVTYVYHKHVGNSKQEGGCYGTPVYHVHVGSEQEYGGCYETPVYHIHKGDTKSGGACYGTAVLHKHEGNASQGGKCYGTAVYHSHVDSCYEEISSREYGCYTVDFWDTSDGDDDEHDFKYYEMSCGEIVYGTNSSHKHKIVICNQENVVVGYTLSCGKTTQSVDSYLLNCVKTEEDIDSYVLSCNTTLEDIDFYAHNCGKDEDTPVGEIILTAKKDSSLQKETVTARFEDLTQGEIQLSKQPFTWYDSSGKVLGTGDTMDFWDNGDYSVVLGVTNKDVNEDNLRVSVKVTGIIQPEPEKEEDDSGDGDENEDNSGLESEDSNGEEPFVTPLPVPTATPILAPTAAPAAASEAVMNTDGGNGSGKGKVETKEKILSDVDEKDQKLPAVTPTLRRETKTVTLEEKSSEREEIPEVKAVEPRQSFLKTPVGKLITITSGSLLLLTGLFTILYLLRWSVKVYNDDGKGDMTYLGRCKVKLEEDGYSIEITDVMAEKSVTNRYCIKPGLFALLKGEEEEMLVIKGQKRVSVSLSREMIAVI